MGDQKHSYGIGTARISLPTEPHGRDERDIKFQIHHMEAEAYHSVLKAFSAQSNNLSWSRESVMTELRKELNITDDEHGELLVKIKSDESIKMIREWQKDSLCAKDFSKDAPRYPPKLEGNARHRKLETSHPAVSSKSRKYALCSQHCTAVIPSAAPHQGQISNDQRSGDLAMLSSGIGAPSMNIVCPNIQAAPNRRSSELLKSKLKMGFHTSGFDNFKKRSDLIEIRATDKLIHEVEKLINCQEILYPVHVEKAKLILQEHERAIFEALGKLADVLGGDDSAKKMLHRHTHEELPGIGRKLLVLNDCYGQAGRLAL